MRSVTASPQRESKPNVYLESRYIKLVRDLPQTIFYCPECRGDRRRSKDCPRCEGRGKITRDSVQELLGRRLLPAFRGKFGKFHGAGREDMDALMLGRGRPFVYEVVAARRLDVDLDDLLERFHEQQGERVRLQPFRRVERTRIAELKTAQYAKRYGLVVELGGSVATADVNALVGTSYDLAQRTPTRVAHRRADLARARQVQIESAVALAADRLELTIRCDHGTYVKEWVSGDGGRTVPSLASGLGVAALCAQLDVLEILDG